MVISYDIEHVIEDYRWTIYIIGIIALGVYKSDRYLYVCSVLPIRSYSSYIHRAYSKSLWKRLAIAHSKLNYMFIAWVFINIENKCENGIG